MNISDLATANRMIPIGNRRAWRGDGRLGQNFYSGILPGDYLLKDNSVSISTQWDQEKGILIDSSGNYLSLINFPCFAVSGAEALGYCKAVGVQLPSKESLKTLGDVLPAVNQSLKCVGLDNMLIPQNPVQNCWSKEDVIDGKTGIRRIVVIEKAVKFHFCDLNVQGSSGPEFSNSIGIEAISYNYNDPVWLLQKIGPWYYVLESRCKFYAYQKDDRSENGSFYLEGDQLVVENPTGETFYEKNVRYAKTVKDYFKKDQYGLYRKVGSAEGAVWNPHRYEDD